jgi:long-chain acyl-CoA synthetase
VAHVAVIRVPDEALGEEVCAVEVPAPVQAVLACDGLVAWARERLGAHKFPRRVEIIEALPMGPSHKVLKRELRKRYGGTA